MPPGLSRPSARARARYGARIRSPAMAHPFAAPGRRHHLGGGRLRSGAVAQPFGGYLQLFRRTLRSGAWPTAAARRDGVAVAEDRLQKDQEQRSTIGLLAPFESQTVVRASSRSSSYAATSNWSRSARTCWRSSASSSRPSTTAASPPPARYRLRSGSRRSCMANRLQRAANLHALPTAAAQQECDITKTVIHIEHLKGLVRCDLLPLARPLSNQRHTQARSSRGSSSSAINRLLWSSVFRRSSHR